MSLSFLLTGLSCTAPAIAARPQVVTVLVADLDGAPVPNAWVRIPGTTGRRLVEPQTGLWEATTVYNTDGSARIFVRGMALDLTVTAPGYRPERVHHRVRRRRNHVSVVLEPMQTPAILIHGVDTIDALMEQWFEAHSEATQ